MFCDINFLMRNVDLVSPAELYVPMKLPTEMSPSWGQYGE